MLERPELPRRESNDFLDTPCNAVGYFSTGECLQIRELSASLSTLEGGVSAKGTLAHDIRSSNIRWMTPMTGNQWVFEKLWAAVEQVNQSYRFELDGIREVQIARYGQGDFYDWHVDIGKAVTSTRKLSVTLQLSDPGSYEGGELVVQYHEDKEPVKEIGSVIVFPSYLSHRANRIIRGERWSLVAWAHGPAFR